MSELATVARPYARAAFELARETQSIAEWGQVLDALATAIADEGDQSFITNPNISQQQIVQELLDGFAGKLDKLQEQFIRLLVSTHRLLVMADIARLFHSYQAVEEQSVQAEISSARPLDHEQIQTIREALTRRIGKTVHISTQVDESLLGGAVIRAGDQVIDGSLKNRLRSLSTALAH